MISKREAKRRFKVEKALEKESRQVQAAINLKRSMGLSQKNICKRHKRSLYWVRKALGCKEKKIIAVSGEK